MFLVSWMLFIGPVAWQKRCHLSKFDWVFDSSDIQNFNKTPFIFEYINRKIEEREREKGLDVCCHSNLASNIDLRPRENGRLWFFDVAKCRCEFQCVYQIFIRFTFAIQCGFCILELLYACGEIYADCWCTLSI